MELTPSLGKRIKTLRSIKALLSGNDYSRVQLVLDSDFVVPYATLKQVEEDHGCELCRDVLIKLGDALMGTGNGHLLVQKEWINTNFQIPLPATDPNILDQIAALSEEEEDDYYSEDSEIVSLSEIEMWS